MLNSLDFAKQLTKITNFFAGVPDSTLKHIVSAIEQSVAGKNFHTSVNEGQAVALAAGYTLATGKPACIYMQNSGLGNAINPLLSLNDPLVFSIPALLIIGWRGEPGTKDEPQHAKQGLVTEALLDACQIPYKILPSDPEAAIATLAWAKDTMETTSAPVALLVQSGIFSEIQVLYKNNYSYPRESAITDIISCATENELILATTGMISRELHDLRVKQVGCCKDFLAVGSMGHVSQIALGFAINKPDKKIICLDGDGSVLMHMGSLVTAGQAKPKNLIHIMLNNAAHDSVGGHPTDAAAVDWSAVALACGYDNACSIDNPSKLKSVMQAALDINGCQFIEVKVAQGARKDLGRPSKTPRQMKVDFVKQI